MTSTGSAFVAGGEATIVATVYPYAANFNIANFFYAADASNPIWTYIGTVRPIGSQAQTDVEMTYTLPDGADYQAVRVQFTSEYSESENFISFADPNPCTGGNDYDDHDDLVFRVISPSESLSASPSDLPSLSPSTSPIQSTTTTSTTTTTTTATTSNPSAILSSQPSEAPSKLPSESPSYQSSSQPSEILSSQPSSQLSNHPTSQLCLPSAQKVKI